MITMQPTLKNGRNVWDAINMPPAEFKDRIRQVKKKIKQERLDVLFVYAYAYDEYANTAYLSNFLVDLTRGDMVAVTKQGEVTLFFEGSPRGLPSAKTTTWVEDVRACPNISHECVKYLEEKDLLSSRVGFAGVSRYMPHQQYDFLTNALSKATIIDAGHIISDMRMIKSPRERDQVQRAARIIKNVFESLDCQIFSALNEKSVEAFIFREARMEGAEDVRVLLGKPQQEEWAFAPSDHEILGAEQTVIVHLCVEFERYWAEGVRTFVIKNTTLVKQDMDSVTGIYEAIMTCLKPEKTGGECYQKILSLLKKNGDIATLDYGLGQGIGLSPGERPHIQADESALLEEGMCLTLRLPLVNKDVGAFMIGDTFWVSKNGLEILTR